jgi:Ca2+-transporting ATPase
MSTSSKSSSDDLRPNWPAVSVAEAVRLLETDPQQGLDAAEAARRRATDGPNSLPEPPRRPPWRLFVDQFCNVLTLVLFAAGVLAGVIGDTSDMAVILVVVVFNAILGFHQEWRAEQILGALRALLAHHCRIRRGGVEAKLPSDQLVRGDLVLLEAGDRVPADGRLVTAHRLHIDESILTGESLAVIKDISALPDEATALGDRRNMAFMNSVVTCGRGAMLVTAIGTQTEIGRVFELVGGTEPPITPLQRRLDRLGNRLAVIAVAVVGVILTMGLLRGEPLVQIMLTSIALAVAAIPEGLPAVVTITLAIGMARMTGRGAVVKRMAAVETLGSTTVICSDKTGTLTLNRMSVRALYSGGRRLRVTGDGYDSVGDIHAEDGGSLPELARLLQSAWLCSDSRIDDGRLIGDPTEGALMALAAKAGVSMEAPPPRVAEIPFESATRFMATYHRQPDGSVLLCVKGAPGVVLDLCAARLAPSARQAALAQAAELGGEALRVIALASARLPAMPDDPHSGSSELEFLGLAGLMDPPRDEAREAIRLCRRAGIAVKMITGDHAVTASAIARLLGLEGAVVSGPELDAMSEAALLECIDSVAVFARVSPEHKLRVVRALRQAGHVVAMTGDGVNDAAALKAADIGVAMGASGSDVAREAAAMVLTDDNFATIVGAVREGRTIYDNIVKFVRFQLSTNVGALLTVFAAPLIGLPLPFNPIQILWVNIIMDGPPAMALAFDPPHPGIMAEPPRRRDEDILPWSRLWRLLAYGVTMAVGTLGVFALGLHLGDSEIEARSLAFTTFVLFQVFNSFNARVGQETIFGANFFTNTKLWLALGAVVVLQAVVVEWPPAEVLFHTASLSLRDWAMAFAVASSVVVLDEARKLVRRAWCRRRDG